MSTSTLTCQLHKKHTPRNLTVEVHHIIPVAWQLFWQPTTSPFPGKDPDGRGELWDARTIALCPTGHRNVHFVIVEDMHALAAGVPLVRKGLTPGLVQLAAFARVRFEEVGGSLQALIAAGQWGQS